MCDNDILEALDALRDADQNLEAPVAVEARVVAAYRRWARRRVWMRASLGTIGAAAIAAAAAVVIAVGVHPQHSEPGLVTQPVSVAPTAPVAPADPADNAVRPAEAPRQRVNLVRADGPREVYTDFYPLIDLAPPFERGELVRVTVPASAMSQVGMLVTASHLDDPIEADVLIGQDGLARAIRFVTYQ